MPIFPAERFGPTRWLAIHRELLRASELQPSLAQLGALFVERRALGAEARAKARSRHDAAIDLEHAFRQSESFRSELDALVR